MNRDIPSLTPTGFIAHRGASIAAPENTIPAFELAFNSGFEWIEVDCQITKDNRPVIIHDNKVNRTTNGTGFVCDHNLDDLRALNANLNIQTMPPTHIPTLEETLECVLKHNGKIVLEVKPILGLDIETARVVSACINEMWSRDNNSMVVSSFSALILKEIRRLCPWVPLALATEIIPRDIKAYIDELKICGLHTQYERIFTDDFKCVLDTGLHISAATTNDREMARKLLATGVQSVMTDSIDMLVKEKPVEEIS